MENIFVLKQVTKIFGADHSVKVKALDSIDFEIKKGEFTAVVGPSGSGKSTLLNLMSGFDYPSSGSVEIAAKNLSDLKGDQLADFRRDHIGFIFQSYNLIPVLNVAENIEYVMTLKKIAKSERRDRVAQMLKNVGLENMEKRFPRELSGGQQQRVAVARAMVSNPEILLADEPTANLDSKTGTALVDMMLKLNEDFGTTFVFSTHDNMIMEKAKRLVTLQDGKILSDERRS